MPGIDDEFRAIIMILKYHGWNYTQVLYSTDAYSNDDVMRFRHLAAQAGICVVASYNMDEDSDMTVSLLSQQPTVRPVVLLLSPDNHREFLEALSNSGSGYQNEFIATSTLGNNAQITAGYEAMAEGFMSIDIRYSSLTQFYNQLSSLRVGNYLDNPWFEEWFESSFNCYVGDNPMGYSSACNTTVGITNAPGFVRDLRVMHVINAVYAIARGLNSVLTRSVWKTTYP